MRSIFCVAICSQGIHDIHPNGTIPGQSGSPVVYAAELANITAQLQQLEPQAKLLFAVTSPILCNAASDKMVAELNKQAVPPPPLPLTTRVPTPTGEEICLFAGQNSLLPQLAAHSAKLFLPRRAGICRWR